MTEQERNEVITSIIIMNNSLRRDYDRKDLESLEDEDLAHIFKSLTRFMKKNKIQRPSKSFVSNSIFWKIQEISKNNTKKTKRTINKSITLPSKKQIQRDSVDFQILNELKNLKQRDFTGEKEQGDPFFDEDKLKNVESETLDTILALCLWFLCIKEEKEVPENQKDQWKQQKNYNQKLKEVLQVYDRAEKKNNQILFYKLNSRNDSIQNKKITFIKMAEFIKKRKEKISQKIIQDPMIKIQFYFPNTRDFQYALYSFKSTISDWDMKSIEECYQDLRKVLHLFLNKNDKLKTRNLL